ncbi:MAG: insulinase family protein [Rhodobacteraceae bacterium]|jgi:zinc protease|nr:insulinase family protein [Paracoccaceae bacterium]
MIRVLTVLAALVVLALPVRADVTIEEVVSPGGIRAWLVQEPSIPFVALELRFRGGTSLDPADKRGATYLMTGLLEEGAGDMDAQAFAQAREGLAASLSFDAYDDEVSVSARFLTENRDAGVDLLRAALVEPRFDQDAIDRVRAQVIAGLRSDAQNPGRVAGMAFDAAMFGDHPYGTPREGTEQTVAALTRDDLLDARARVLVRDRVVVGAVGDITPEALGLMLDRLLGELPQSGGSDVPPAPHLLTGGLTVVDFRTPQAVAIFGHRGIRQEDPDFFAAFLVDHILGGAGFESRLMQEVREKRGLTYGIGTSLVSLDRGEMVIGQVATANGRMAETVEVLRAEWARIGEQGVTAEELERAKTYITGAYPLRFDGNARIASILVGMQLSGLPIDYIATRNDRINAVTLEEANRVARELYRPEDLHILIVGQPAGLESAPAN